MTMPPVLEQPFKRQRTILNESHQINLSENTGEVTFDTPARVTARARGYQGGLKEKVGLDN